MLQKYALATKKLSPGIRSPVTATRNAPCKVTCTSMTWNSQPFHGFSAWDFKHRFRKSPKSLRLPREKHRFRLSSKPPSLPRFLQPSGTPARATYFATSRNPCACHAKHTLNLHKCPATANFWRFWFPNRSRATAWCKLYPSKIERSSAWKSVPNPRCFHDLDFEIALAQQRGANFVEVLGSRSSAPPRFSDLTLRGSKRQKYRKTQHFAQFLPAKLPHVPHLRCKTFMLKNIYAIKHRCCKTRRQLSA